jgi:hypothetical protein
MHFFMDSLPFSETLEGETHIRTFSADVDPSELKWHQDGEDRIVEATHESDWMYQADNELPRRFKDRILIRKGEWHRVIKGTGDLTLRVTKLPGDPLPMV